MGIGNRVHRQARHWRHPPLITPHGDRKPTTAAGNTGPGRRSLPLMGIGNATRRAASALAISRLITPHGDRKPSPTPGAPTTNPAHSLPLMGIGNSGPTAAKTRGWTCSLPLMGIGNKNTDAGGRSSVFAHYPSWGSETAESHGARRGRRVPHYPSWGSETQGHAAAALLRIALITPHGDRKPAADQTRVVRIDGSLPLMGIGNAHNPLTWCPAVSAHYPSWGSETPAPTVAGALPVVAHYPSWGSETLLPRAASPSTRSPHYPSWGSETLPMFRELERNPHLITPHGDRKQSSESPRSPSSRPLITPHGDRKLDMPVSGSRRCTNSLPLMGIGNPRIHRRSDR